MLIAFSFIKKIILVIAVSDATYRYLHRCIFIQFILRNWVHLIFSVVKTAYIYTYLPHTFRRGVDALAVLNGPLEHVGELCLVAEVVGADKVHHAPVLHQVVLQRVAWDNRE